MLLRRLKYPNTVGLILRRTHPELYKSHIVKLFEEYPSVRPWYNDQKHQLSFPNGSILFFGSAMNEKAMADYYSAEFADIMVDEAQEFSQSEIERLYGSNRCTSNNEITSKMILSFMPGSCETGLPPKGLSFLKRVFVDGALNPQEQSKSWSFIQAYAWDNIEWCRKELVRDQCDEADFYSWDESTRREYFLTRTEFGKTLLSVTDPHLRDAWLYGKWDVFQGQYFPNFDPVRHVVTSAEARERIKPWHKKWISGDWGFDHPHCFHWHSQDENGRVITYREQFGRQMGETDLGATLGKLNLGDKTVAFPFSWDAGKLSPRSQAKYPKSIIQMLSDALPQGMPRPHPADSTPGSRASGARLMYQLLDSNMWQISADCPRLIECIPSLIRNPDSTEDVLKVDWVENNIGDDPYDSARMGLQYMLGASRKPEEEAVREYAATIEDPVSKFFYLKKQNDRLKQAKEVKAPRTIPTWQKNLS